MLSNVCSLRKTETYGVNLKFKLAGSLLKHFYSLLWCLVETTHQDHQYKMTTAGIAQNRQSERYLHAHIYMGYDSVAGIVFVLCVCVMVKKIWQVFQYFAICL